MTDAVGPHMLQKHEIDECWSTDYHLGLTGVPPAIHTH